MLVGFHYLLLVFKIDCQYDPAAREAKIPEAAGVVRARKFAVLSSAPFLCQNKTAIP